MQDKNDIKISEHSFLVQIRYRQNSSWQGNVQWIEAGKTQHFKSCMELIRLMDIALLSEAEEKEKIGWDDGE